jgi:Ca2+-transporting ATPase
MANGPHAVVLARNGRWAKLRVRGLLKNAALAARLEEAMCDTAEAGVTIMLSTGSVRVPLRGARDDLYWIERVTAIVRFHQPAAPSAAMAPRTGSAAPRPTSALDPAQPARPRPSAPTTYRAPNRPADPKSPVAVVDGGAGAPHAQPRPALFAHLDPERGLRADEAAARLARDGRNEILDITGRSAAQILVGQFNSVPVGLLAASGGLALATRAFADAAAIGAVLAANAGLGFVTEKQAEDTVSSLRKLRPRQATVLRDGQPLTVDAAEVVVGDLLLLEPGEPVAADARVVQSHRLTTNEAALTGESLPVRKEAIDALPADTPLGERRNMVYLGTVVSGGAGRAVVVATAERTALGHIRALAQGAEAPRTQLQQELDTLGRRLAIGAALLCGGVIVLGLLRRRPLVPLVRTAVSLGVAAIPEGLPTVATSLLARGIRTLRERQVYARRLDAVENLGAVDTVCFDKTGTLTQNRMSVASLTLGLRWVRLAAGAETPSAQAATPPAVPEAWLHVAALCNSIEPRAGEDEADGEASELHWQGSSTELALVEFAIAQGLAVTMLRQRHPPLAVRHRSEHHPYMVTLHDSAANGLLVAVKGRPDAVLARCETWFDGERTRALDDTTRRSLLAMNDRMAEAGERVLALAFRQHPGQKFGETTGLSWLGLVGLADPLRPGLRDMVRRFSAAGIRTLMITGDQPGTARAVAESIGLDRAQGLASGDGVVVDAARLPESAAALADIAERAVAFARTSPAMKLEIVRALQLRGHVVAMTGDGINDGPALKTADVGVAMGATGTDFAHAMSDLVLRDDHPAAMLPAIEEGRTAFVNVKKSMRYLVATNLSELAATALAVAVGAPDPFDPMHLLWTNLATDVWPAIALGLEPAEPGILERPPVSLRGGLLERSEWGAMAVDSAVMTGAALASFGYGLARHGALPQARTLAFLTLTSSQLLYAFTMRSSRPLRMGGLRPNPQLTRAVGFTLAAQAAVMLLPGPRRLLRVAPVGPLDLAVVGATALLPFLVREGLKELAWRRSTAHPVAAPKPAAASPGLAQREPADGAS